VFCLRRIPTSAGEALPNPGRLRHTDTGTSGVLAETRPSAGQRESPAASGRSPCAQVPPWGDEGRLDIGAFSGAYRVIAARSIRFRANLAFARGSTTALDSIRRPIGHVLDLLDSERWADFRNLRDVNGRTMDRKWLQ
jgi:hypothetical protein